jgi:hypothetical protein
MRSIRIIKATTVFAVLAALSLFGCVSSRTTDQAFTIAPADRALAEFDKSHPSCQLWTNWRKVCSRTGPHGETRCTEDPDFKVQASAPFCAGEHFGFGALLADNPTIAELNSYNRFCKTFETEGLPHKKFGMAICNEWQPNRPFSPQRVDHRVHPWCLEWKRWDTYEPIADPSKTKPYPHGVYCARQSLPDWCVKARGMGTIPYFSPETRPPLISVGQTKYDDYGPVVGVYCGIRK